MSLELTTWARQQGGDGGEGGAACSKPKSSVVFPKAAQNSSVPSHLQHLHDQSSRKLSKLCETHSRRGKDHASRLYANSLPCSTIKSRFWPSSNRQVSPVIATYRRCNHSVACASLRQAAPPCIPSPRAFKAAPRITCQLLPVSSFACPPPAGQGQLFECLLLLHCSQGRQPAPRHVVFHRPTPQAQL